MQLRHVTINSVTSNEENNRVHNFTSEVAILHRNFTSEVEV